MNPLKILENDCKIMRIMKLIEDNPGKTTAELEKLTNLQIATFYRHMAKLRSLGLVKYKQQENETGRPITHYPKYKIKVKRV